MQYDKNKRVRLLSSPIPIKSLPEGKKFPHLIIAPNIKGGEYSDAWKSFARHCENGSLQIKGIGFYQAYSPMAQSYSFRTNIIIVDMHRLTASILDVSNVFQNTNVTIHEILCVSPPPYYLD